jgi:hypothetical protein
MRSRLQLKLCLRYGCSSPVGPSAVTDFDKPADHYLDSTAARLLRHWQASRETEGIDMEKTVRPEPYRPGRPVLQGLLDLRPTLGLEVAAGPVEDPWLEDWP